MSSFIKEFKEFAVKGNVVDIAVGMIIGVAFGKIVSSFVNDVVMPPIGMLVGGVDFQNFSYVLREATEAQEAVTINYGMFINNVIDFVIIAFAIFVAIKAMNRLTRKEEAAPELTVPAAPSPEVELLTEIRDLLRK
ncbi:MAG: large-conductance mechanosensitive channel protein MscL [Candidatus Kapabacteria bacterium]|nr:large-conductance mechanosensitive channel protein MscL [Candidatus Kapabacteria bacterium]